MGVIGRLDDQVDEVIIKPLSERAGGETPAPSKNVEPQASNQQAQERVAEDEDKGAGRSTELPVWLL